MIFVFPFNKINLSLIENILMTHEMKKIPTPTVQSNIWYSPSPGHSRRFDPKKLRESMKLNLSTEVFFTLTSWLNIKLKNNHPLNLVAVPSSTVATVLTQGRRQSEILSPENISPESAGVIKRRKALKAKTVEERGRDCMTQFFGGTPCSYLNQNVFSDTNHFPDDSYWWLHWCCPQPRKVWDLEGDIFWQTDHHSQHSSHTPR